MRSHYGRTTNATMVRFSNPCRARKIPDRFRESPSAMISQTASVGGLSPGVGKQTSNTEEEGKGWRDGRRRGGALEETRGMFLMTAVPSLSLPPSLPPARPRREGETMMMKVAHRPLQYLQRFLLPKLKWIRFFFK